MSTWLVTWSPQNAVVWVSGDSSILIVGFIEAFFFLVSLLRKFLFVVRETEGERERVRERDER